MDDRRALQQLIADIETGFNSNDVELSTKHFARDATAVGVTGSEVIGHDAIVAAHEAGYAGFLKDEHARYELDGVRFLCPDVAIGYVRAWATDRDGTPLTVDHAMVACYVFVRDAGAGTWQVTARQNTLVTR